MSGGDLMDYRESKPTSRCPCGHRRRQADEGVEDPALVARSDPGAEVRHLDHGQHASEVKSEPDRTRWRGVLDGVVDQIGYRSDQEFLLATDWGNVRLGLDRQLMSAGRRQAGVGFLNHPHHSAQVDQGPLRSKAGHVACPQQVSDSGEDACQPAERARLFSNRVQQFGGLFCTPLGQVVQAFPNAEQWSS